MSNREDLIQRWDSFLKKIEGRFDDSLHQAEDACLEQLVSTDYDYYTVFRSWTAMKSQINNIVPKIDETWKKKVEPQMQAIDNGDYFYIDQGYKTSELSDRLYDKMQRFEVLLEGKMSQQFYDHAMNIAHQDFNCSQCGSPLTIRKDLFRAQYVTCNSCNSVNTFEPETKFIQIGWNVIDNIVKVKCLPLQDQMESKKETISNTRAGEHTDEIWQAYKEAYFNYWDSFFKERIKLKSDTQKRYEEDMKRKTLEFNQYMNIQRYNNHGIR